jgi:hypothetical protein
MKKNMPPVETRFKDLSGNISVNLVDQMNFTELASKLAGFNPDRFDAIAVRVFIEKGLQVTIYALDKSRQDNSSKTDKLPVHKFKLDGVNLSAIMPMIQQLNFTLTTGEFNLEDMEVINK